MGRAIAHGRTPVAKFSDPTALALLPNESRDRVQRLRDGVAPRGLRGRLERSFLENLSKMMVARTVAIDEAVRRAAHPQVVILGAGLDGRAWRMTELGGVTVFEVDHPDSQREKRARVSVLKQVARDVRFVPVDLARDKLGDALASAGHDPVRATTWIWEGVVIYLTKVDIEATLSVLDQRSASGSCLIITYQTPSLLSGVIGLLLGRLGEPHRSAFKVDAMRFLLAKFGFRVTQDENLPTIAHKLSADISQATRHLRIATAARS